MTTFALEPELPADKVFIPWLLLKIVFNAIDCPADLLAARIISPVLPLLFLLFPNTMMIAEKLSPREEPNGIV